MKIKMTTPNRSFEKAKSFPSRFSTSKVGDSVSWGGGVGDLGGSRVGCLPGSRVGFDVGALVGDSVGSNVGESVGDFVAALGALGALVGGGAVFSGAAVGGSGSVALVAGEGVVSFSSAAGASVGALVVLFSSSGASVLGDSWSFFEATHICSAFGNSSEDPLVQLLPFHMHT